MEVLSMICFFTIEAELIGCKLCCYICKPFLNGKVLKNYLSTDYFSVGMGLHHIFYVLNVKATGLLYYYITVYVEQLLFTNNF